MKKAGDKGIITQRSGHRMYKRGLLDVNVRWLGESPKDLKNIDKFVQIC